MDRLIHTIYEAVGNTDRWSAVLDRLASSTQSQTVVLEINPGSALTTRFFAAGVNSGAKNIHDWESCVAETGVPFTLDEGQTRICNDYTAMHVPPRFANLLKQYTVLRSISCYLGHNSGYNFTLHAMRHPQSEPFLTSDQHSFTTLSEHLWRGITMHLGGTMHDRIALTAPIFEVGATYGLIAVTQDNMAIALNRAAERLTADRNGLSISMQGNLVAADPAANRALQALLHDAFQTRPHSDLTHIGSLRLQSYDSPETLVAVRSIADKDAIFGIHQRMALVYFGDGKNNWPDLVAPLMQLFSLTRAEARVAELIILNNESCDIQDKLNIQESTLRYHMRSIYQKVGATNKGDLIHRLNFSLPFI